MITLCQTTDRSGQVYLAPIESSWCFGANLLGREAVSLLEDTMVEIEGHYAPEFPKIIISGIKPTGSVYRLLRSAFRDRFEFGSFRTGIQCGAALSGGFEGYLSRRSSNTRRNIKKQTRRLLEAGVAFERHSSCTPLEAEILYERMISVELASWKGIGHCGMAENSISSFYRAMIRRLSETGDTRVIMARFEDKDIGFIFGGMAGRIYRGQQFSYDEDWAAGSIGNVMQAEQIKWLCEEGATRYDLGPFKSGRMEYKSHWVEQSFGITSEVLTRRGAS